MTTLITGASRGIGAALFARARASGEDAIGTARRPAQGSDLLPLDVTDPASVADLARRLDGRPLARLVCNAGVYLDKGESLDTGYPAEMWAESFAVNVTGVFLTIQALLPNLRAHGAGAAIAVIASQMGSQARAPGGSYIYRASKAAAINLARNLAADLAPGGIAVAAYHPGWVRTDMGGDAADLAPDEAARGLWSEIAALDMARTGAFRTWDGRDHPL